MKKGLVILLVLISLFSLNIVISEELSSNVNDTFSININKPSNDYYNKKQVFLDIVSDKVIDKINYISTNDVTLSEKILCNRCSRFYGSKTFGEGMHVLKIIGKNRLIEVEKNITFFIDSIKPRLSVIYPRSNNFVNGKNFQIKLLEENPKKLLIFYGNDLKGIITKEINMSKNCIKEEEYSCNFNLDLENYNGEKIYFYYTIEDIAKNSFKSTPIWVKVDTISPVVENPDSFVVLDGRYFNFKIAIIENNLKSVNFIDSKEENPKINSICTSLRNGLCEKRILSKSNGYNITLFVIDKSGNSDSVNSYYMN